MLKFRIAERLAALVLSALPATAMAQDSIVHGATYTRGAEGLQLLAKNAKAARARMPLVSSSKLPVAALLRGNAVAAPATHGAAGGSSDGVHEDALPKAKIVPFAYGTDPTTSIAPYTTARASATDLGPTPTASAVGVTSYPWRATGKLYFTINASPYVCSASLIKPGLVLTAAHCVFEFGLTTRGWHSDYLFVPAQYDLTAPAPYGTWTALQERIPASYYDGTDTCEAGSEGIVCNNDIAILTMRPDTRGRLPGRVVGWYGYQWNGYSFKPSFGGASLASITQLGYPVALDSGLMMERTDGIGSYWQTGNLKNALIGSALSGGASGGPWLVNFGATPSVDFDGSLGNAALPNLVIGVLSWGYSNPGINTSGASWFGQNREFSGASYKDSHGIDRGAGNIGNLVARACSANFDHC